MKKFSTIIMAIALVLGLSQCKKQETPTSNNTEDGMVYITVNVDNGGGRHHIEPGVGAYVFTNGDILYVGNNGHFIGTLEYQSGAFSGTITSPSTSDYLHFYFLGGKTPASAPTTSTTDFTISIADQSGNLPILSYGRSTGKYTDEYATYTTTLRNQCGLVKFVPATETSETIIVGGFYNTATIDFATPGITPTGEPGNITLFAESDAAKWAILLPQTGVSPTATISGYDCSIEGTIDITNNCYNSTGVNISMTVPDLRFSVGVNTKVLFASGNLQYKNGEGWRFAEHQWDFTGAWNTSSWVDLFGWGTWGEGKNPLETDDEGANYHWSTDFQGELDGHSDWRTLTQSEWDFVINNSNRGSNRYLKANIAVGSINYNGLILFPDNYDGADLTGSYTYNNTSGWTSVSAGDWSAMEAVGAVFLPAAGNRYGTDVYDDGDYGSIWSSTPDEDYDAYGVDFNDGFVSPGYYDRREYGQSVRLVRNAE